jgi:hypothetical protein
MSIAIDADKTAGRPVNSSADITVESPVRENAAGATARAVSRMEARLLPQRGSIATKTALMESQCCDKGVLAFCKIHQFSLTFSIRENK